MCRNAQCNIPSRRGLTSTDQDFEAWGGVDRFTRWLLILWWGKSKLHFLVALKRKNSSLVSSSDRVIPSFQPELRAAQLELCV